MTDVFLNPTPRRKQQLKRYSTARWRRTREAVLDRDGWTCQVPRRETGGTPPDAICGRPARICDHVTRPEQGGTDEMTNLRAACKSCNLRRHGVKYFRELADAAAAGTPAAHAFPDARAGRPPIPEPAMVPLPSGRPPTSDPRRFVAWAMELTGVGGPPDHDHASRWAVNSSVTFGGRSWQVCAASCPSPVRWPAPPTPQEEAP